MTVSQQIDGEQIKTGALQDAIFNSAHFSSIATDERGVIQIFNVGAERMLGYAASDVVNRITPADISDQEELVERAAALSVELEAPIAPGFEALVFKASRGIEDIYQLTYVRKDGSRFPAMVSVTALRDAEDRIIGYLLIGTDNTARKEVEAAQARLDEQLQQKNVELQRFRTAMDLTGDGIFLIDRRTMRFVEVNATASQMSGYTRQELLELGPSALRPERREQLEDQYDPVIGHGTTRTTETLRRKDGSLVPVEAHRHAQRSGDDWIIVAVLRDITERKEAEERMEHLAHYDALTGLPNRTLFYDTLKTTLVHASSRGLATAVLFIDVDHFKHVNDTLGHAIGDELLIQVSRRLIGSARSRDTVGRLGGDEFAIIVVSGEETQDPLAIARRVQSAFQEPFELNGQELMVTASIGITVHPDDALEPDTLIKYADTAMYQAKQAGRDTIRFFTTKMNRDVLARRDLESALRRAVKNKEFVLHYQPKVRLESGRRVGLEALLRWERPGVGLVPPKDFIPALEDTGLILEVGSWVIGAACRQIDLWRLSPVGPVPVSVNVAGLQLMKGDLEGDVARALHDSGIPPHLLDLELTESMLMANTDHSIATLENLKVRGVGISIDDFGTGYSGLAYLRRFPIDKLKIDISFIREITTNADAAAIAIAIIQMAHSLNLDVVAEGVETEAQLAYLRRHHCDEVQGYFFSRPLTLPAIETLLLSGAALPTPDPDTSPGQATVLAVDDDPKVLEALQLLLGDDGYRILTADSAAQGFEQLALHEVQVLLCDERMPGMSGTDFLARVKEMHPDTLRIVLSSCADDRALIGSINRGEVYRYYQKPWDAATLRENLHEAFRHYWHLHDASGAREPSGASGS